MSNSEQIAKHLKDVFFGGNWTGVNLKQVLEDVDYEMANRKVESLNTIATLVNHLGYYVGVIDRVLKGGPLEGKDADSFIYDPITSEDQWQKKLEDLWAEVESCVGNIEKLDDGVLSTDFADPKYGSHLRNYMGLIEHTHYHLGQISLLKKIIASRNV